MYDPRFVAPTSAGNQPAGMPNTYPFQGLNPNIRSRPLLDAIMAGGEFLGNLGQFAGGVSQLGNFVSGGQGLGQGPIGQAIQQGIKPQGGGNGGGGGGMGQGPLSGGTGAPFGTQQGNYGPLTGAILKHTPQSVLMNTSGPMYQIARDFYMGPARPSFAQAH